jgi:hypothetical protein
LSPDLWRIGRIADFDGNVHILYVAEMAWDSRFLVRICTPERPEKRVARRKHLGSARGQKTKRSNTMLLNTCRMKIFSHTWRVESGFQYGVINTLEEREDRHDSAE